MIPEITARELKARLDTGEVVDIIDVREDWELDLSHLDLATHIRMNDIPESLDRIPQDKPVVIMCHLGSRSAAVVNWLQTQGYTNVYNLEGGIDAWAADVDPSVGLY